MAPASTRDSASILHLDLDAFFAAVEQRDKPSLRGKAVIVGGVGARGVVSTASYEARAFGVRSAMSMAEARARCPNAAVLAPRFAVYREASDLVFGVLRRLSPLVEPLSLDEAFVDLAAGVGADTALSVDDVVAVATDLRQEIRALCELTASVGAGTTKTVAKIASERAKPDGILVVPPGAETAVMHPLPVRDLWGVGPATAARLARMGVRTIGDLTRTPEAELVGALGRSHGLGLARLARGEDPRAVVAERDSKSVSAEDTFEQDVVDPTVLRALLGTLSARVAGRLVEAGVSGRTVTVKARHHDFTTVSRSATLPGPTDDVDVVTELAQRLLADLDTTGGLRLLGVGVSGLADWVQDDLFSEQRGQPPAGGDPTPPPGDADTDGTGPDIGDGASSTSSTTAPAEASGPAPPSWPPGSDIRHDDYGVGWVWGSGRGRVTVRFEHRGSAVGPVRTFAIGDPALRAA